MRRITWIRLGGLVLAGLAVTGIAVVTQNAQAAEIPTAKAEPSYTPPPGAPTPGDKFRIYEVYTVQSGTQTYTCTADGVFGATSTPEAVLHSIDHPMNYIHHYAGPRWTFLRDKSTLLGTVVARVDQPDSIPWLLLSVQHEAAGYLDDTSYVGRYDTRGGVAPTGACTPGTTVAVPYSAHYVLWEQKD